MDWVGTLFNPKFWVNLVAYIVNTIAIAFWDFAGRYYWEKKKISGFIDEVEEKWSFGVKKVGEFNDQFDIYCRFLVNPQGKNSPPYALELYLQEEKTRKRTPLLEIDCIWIQRNEDHFEDDLNLNYVFFASPYLRVKLKELSSDIVIKEKDQVRLAIALMRHEKNDEQGLLIQTKSRTDFSIYGFEQDNDPYNEQAQENDHFWYMDYKEGDDDSGTLFKELIKPDSDLSKKPFFHYNKLLKSFPKNKGIF